MFKKFWNWLRGTQENLSEEQQRWVEWAEASLAALDWSQQGDCPVEAPKTAQEPSKQPCTTCPSLGPCQKHQEASDALEEKSHEQN